MKKLIFLFSLCLLLAGCTVKNESVTLPAPEPATKPVAQTNWIQPLPTSLDLENLGSCTLSVSLAEGDVYTDGAGVTRMKLNVYTYDVYGAADNDLHALIHVYQHRRADAHAVQQTAGDPQSGGL